MCSNLGNCHGALDTQMYHITLMFIIPPYSGLDYQSVSHDIIVSKKMAAVAFSASAM